jgi:hypothetical protein
MKDTYLPSVPTEDKYVSSASSRRQKMLLSKKKLLQHLLVHRPEPWWPASMPPSPRCALWNGSSTCTAMSLCCTAMSLHHRHRSAPTRGGREVTVPPGGAAPPSSPCLVVVASPCGTPPSPTHGGREGMPAAARFAASSTTVVGFGPIEEEGRGWREMAPTLARFMMEAATTSPTPLQWPSRPQRQLDL